MLLLSSTNFMIRNILYISICIYIFLSAYLSIHPFVNGVPQGACNFRKKFIERFRNHWEHLTFNVQARTRPGAGPECCGSSDNRGSDFSFFQC